ncbi:response regulator receiver modulated metal dependent phosphohydrolase [Luminiphilus syltensis NOR5-1B]|uniref:Response regulator receiver modulated metal dependent phosphohydrolase n=1 Tax=Luminiphilus syltensis NOR5-1B TaxID=565045 RepID=B8KTG2_9GAMM|nr:HD domain-containing phosphohydrolase [Luminiphilus syltensis]EED35200.1 response regulator receiver modulated metal dependent phosphohydrolase [Luminiphilus syltensis NOR5-1B]
MSKDATTKQTVLAVDDTPENIDVLVGTLKDEYRVRAAINGEKAIKLARETQPDIILLDIMMPGIDGYEVCRQLKADYTTRHIPIIFITAKNQLGDELHGLELGAVDYITKPFSPPVVKARLATHLALSNQNRELDRKVREKTDEINQTRLAIIQRLGRAAEFKDDDTGLHVIRMSNFSRILGVAAGMSEADAEMLLQAAPMHDIGKIGTPDSVLKKPGKLDEDEWVEMQRHVEIGAEIIGDDDSELLQMARTVALTHHERWDGKGYPKGLRGEEIPLVGRIVAVADVFDALTSVRPYKKGWSVEETVKMIEDNAGSQFDPDLVKLLPEVLDQFLEVKKQYDG